MTTRALPAVVTLEQLITRFTWMYQDQPDCIALFVALVVNNLPATVFNRATGLIDRSGQEIVAEQMESMTRRLSTI